jgi:antitoxin HicB
MDSQRSSRKRLITNWN